MPKNQRFPLDKQLELFKQRNEIYKQTCKDSWDMAPKNNKIQKIIGLHYSDSNEWKLDSKENIYKIKKQNKLEWYKEVKDMEYTDKITINLIQAQREQALTNKFPTIQQHTNLCISDGDTIIFDVLIKEISLSKMAKGITQAGTEGRCDKKGNKQNKWCYLAVFNEAYIKCSDNVYIKMTCNSNENVAKIVQDKEKNGQICFQFGLGYCKLADDNEYMYGIINISSEYLVQTSLDILVVCNHDLKGDLTVNLRHYNIKKKDIKVEMCKIKKQQMVIFPTHSSNVNTNNYVKPIHNPNKFLSEIQRLYNHLTQNCINNSYGIDHLIHIENDVLNVLHKHVIRTGKPKPMEQYIHNFNNTTHLSHHLYSNNVYPKQYHNESMNIWAQSNSNQNVATINMNPNILPIFNDYNNSNNNNNNNNNNNVIDDDNDYDIKLDNNSSGDGNQDPPKKKRKKY